jgi:serine-threonine kinase receptor-associated protein
MLETPKVVPLTCHGHSRPVTHLNYSAVVEEDQFYLISASKGTVAFDTYFLAC